MLEWCLYQGIYKFKVTENNLAEKNIMGHFAYFNSESLKKFICH